MSGFDESTSNINANVLHETSSSTSDNKCQFRHNDGSTCSNERDLGGESYNWWCTQHQHMYVQQHNDYHNITAEDNTDECRIRRHMKEILLRSIFSMRFSFNYCRGHHIWVKDLLTAIDGINKQRSQRGEPIVPISSFYQKLALFHYAHVQVWYQENPAINNINALMEAEQRGDLVDCRLCADKIAEYDPDW